MAREAETMARALRGTYDRRLRAFRPLPDGGERAVYRDEPCALSRRAQTAAPGVVAGGAALAETRYALAHYTAPSVVLALNDRVCVSDGAGRWYHARVSDSMRYASHCVTVAEVLGVTADAETAGFGQSSREDKAEGGEA